MANTTNFGWETPDDTDLVKDGAAAMRTLGNSIDASFVDLKGGTTGQVLAKASNTDLDFTWTNGGDITAVTAGIGLTGGGTSGDVTLVNAMADAITTKGDLIAGTAADTFARLGVGTNGQFLAANSATATGLEWQTISAGGMTLLATLNCTNGSNYLAFTSISQNYKHLLLTWDYVINSSASGSFYFNINDDNANHLWTDINVTGSSTSASTTNANYWQYFATPNNSTPGQTGRLWIYDYANTSRRKAMESTTMGYSTASSALRGYHTWGEYASTSAVTKISASSTVSWGAFGQFRLYGVA